MNTILLSKLRTEVIVKFSREFSLSRALARHQLLIMRDTLELKSADRDRYMPVCCVRACFVCIEQLGSRSRMTFSSRRTSDHVLYDRVFDYMCLCLRARVFVIAGERECAMLIEIIFKCSR